MNRTRQYLTIAAISTCIGGCASLTLEHVDYAWPVESVVTVSSTSTIDEGRYALSCSVAKLAAEEFQDSTALRGATIRILRSSEGYYFLTGPRFKHVYVFETGRDELSLKSSIEVSKTGLRDPALNQRPPFVELVDGDRFERMLTSSDIVEGKKP